MPDNPVLSLNDAKAHLNLKTNEADTTLPAYIDASVRQVEQRVGPLIVRAVTQRVVGGSGNVLLTKGPVTSVTSVTAVIGGAAVATSTFDLDGSAGILGWVNGYSPLIAGQPYTVTYAAGWAATPADIPADLVLAVKELLRHLWRYQRNGTGKMPQPTEPDRLPGFFMPHLVTGLLEPYMTPGFA